MKRFAIATRCFPVLSETFIINQVAGLIDLGCKVNIITLDEPTTLPEHSTIQDYSMLDRIIKIRKGRNIVERMFRFLISSISLIFKGRFKTLRSIIFDRNLSISQKVDITNMCIDHPSPLVFDQVVVHFGTNGYFFCKLRELGIIQGKISVIFHGFELSVRSEVEQNLIRYESLFNMVDHLLPISNFWKERLISWGAPIDKIIVHRMGVFPEHFNSPTDKNEVNKDKLRILQVGRLVEKKAVLDSIIAIKEFIEILPNQQCELCVIGDGPELDDAKFLVDKYNLGKYVKLLGPQPSQVVYEYLVQSDIFLLPSVVAANGDMEGIPVALMEAMAAGLVTISTYHSGIPELIDDGVSGFLVSEHCPSEIAAAIEKVATIDNEELNSLKMCALSKVEREFNNNLLYKELLAMA